MTKDNSTFDKKAALRLSALMWLDAPPVVIETHGGAGKLFSRCYAHIEQGVVFETDERKADTLAKQRPTWAVYQSDSRMALSEGVGSHLVANVLDCDPYGDAWPAIEAYFASKREMADRMVITVNDGLRHKIKVSGGWDVGSMRSAVAHFGNVLGRKYLEVCRWNLERIAAQAGYRLSRWTAYSCGAKLAMTHYAALLER